MKMMNERSEFLSIQEPYGYIKLKNCTLYEFEQEGSAQYRGQVFKRYLVEGEVVESKWIGAFFAGVPVVKPTERYPVGSIQKIYYVKPEDFERGEERKISCG